MRKEVRGQSHRWPAFTVTFPSDDETWVGKAHVEIRQDGVMSYIDIIPSEDGDWLAVMPLRYEGKVSESKNSVGKVFLALSSSGSWSGGGNYRGWIIGRLGGRVFCGGSGRQYYHFVDETKGWEETGPLKEALPVKSF